MEEGKAYNRSDSDHDLLITLNTRFETFTNQVQSILDLMQGKADKDDVRELRDHWKDLIDRVSKLEVTHRDDKIRKDSLVKVGKLSLDGWQIITGIIITALTIWQLIQTFIVK